VAALSVWTKESSWFLSLPALVLLVARSRGEPARRPLTRLVSLWPAAVPGLALAAWIGAHRVLSGHWVHPDHRGVFSLGTLGAALLHQLVEGGRLPLLLVALTGLRALRPDGERRAEVLATGVALLALPLFFPAALARYMLPGVPFLCALAALGLASLPARRALLAGAALFAWLLAATWGDGWHGNQPYHAEDNLRYRPILAMHVAAAHQVAALAPRRVVARFPFLHILGDDGRAGYLDRPLPAHPASDGELASLCASDLLVTTPDDGLDAIRARLAAAGALQLVETLVPTPPVGQRAGTPGWARFANRVEIYRIACDVTP
jgi:hypothetical protein